MEGLTIVGTAREKEPVFLFIRKKEMSNNLRNTGVGDLSAQPLIKILGVKALLRLSFSYYNTIGEIDALVQR